MFEEQKEKKRYPFAKIIYMINIRKQNKKESEIWKMRSSTRARSVAEKNFIKIWIKKKNLSKIYSYLF